MGSIGAKDTKSNICTLWDVCSGHSCGECALEPSKNIKGATKSDNGKPQLSLVSTKLWQTIIRQHVLDGNNLNLGMRLTELCTPAPLNEVMARIHSCILFIVQEWDPHTLLTNTAKAMEFGAARHGRNNYRKGLGSCRWLDAALRHYAKMVFLHEDTDEECGSLHIGNILFCLQALQANEQLDSSLWGGMVENN